ncbi:hypothetical protein H8356DRAFT_938389 [Neocallimastix lanati (nom. inval.)]|uniref:MATH domain-containing protein n=1 Tax=Neocallimastix californiae TaxID=1754190 RepID=A0A1Y2ALQ2_9FUNG|nr:hypothetical protein H8356DRAFT_938389 [Neocallimastix sp. JGI-2020a]ORY23147.1 hypothetical protein LY90DRAFT_515143 [Neocallimastix californiae]|eukprot:ORY23147.1 hypothetical protein LY90DRAFT_515143 [Neocallimastix californiae]
MGVFLKKKRTQNQYYDDLEKILVKDYEDFEEDYFEWEVEKFDSITKGWNDKKTTEFNSCGYTWSVFLYSNGNLKNNNDFFAIELKNNIEKDFSIKVVFMIRNVKTQSYFHDNKHICQKEIYKYEYDKYIKPLIEDNKIIIGVYLRIYHVDKYARYIDELKYLSKEDNKNNEVIKEDYAEWEINHFDRYLNFNYGYKPLPAFELYSYKCLFDNNDHFIIYFQNLNIENYKQICARVTFVFRTYMDTTNFKVFSSSLYCFGKTNTDKGDKEYNFGGYMLKIYKNEYNKYIKPLIYEDKIKLGVYLQIFNNDMTEYYIENLKSLIPRNDIYNIIDENYFEWAIEDWYKLKDSWLNCSPNFKIGNYEWIISFHPFNNGFASLELSVTNSLTLKENEDIYISVVFSIRNSNDFSSHIAKAIPTIKKLNKHKNMVNIEKFIESIKFMIETECLNIKLNENNKLVIGAYVRVYDSDQGNIHFN